MHMYGLLQNSVESVFTYLRLAFDHLGFGSAIYFCIPVIVFNIYILIHWAGFFSRLVLLRLLVYFLH